MDRPNTLLWNSFLRSIIKKNHERDGGAMGPILFPATESKGVVAVAVFDGTPVPTEFIAETRYVYVVFADNPVSEYVVPVEGVIEGQGTLYCRHCRLQRLGSWALLSDPLP